MYILKVIPQKRRVLLSPDPSSTSTSSKSYPPVIPDVRTRTRGDPRGSSRVQVVRRLGRQGQGGWYLSTIQLKRTMLIDTVAPPLRITWDTVSMHPQADGKRTKMFTGITVMSPRPKLSARKKSRKLKSLRQMLSQSHCAYILYTISVTIKTYYSLL
jgi:hypothetical protein